MTSLLFGTVPTVKNGSSFVCPKPARNRPFHPLANDMFARVDPRAVPPDFSESSESEWVSAQALFKRTVFAGGNRLGKMAAWGQLLLLALCFANGLGSMNVRADGKVFSQVALADPQIPDQRALIQYENGIERPVIDTSFKGSGTNFAWVVPLPSVPKIEPVTEGFFPTLQSLFQPTIIHEHPWGALGILLLGLVSLTVLRAIRNKKDVLATLLAYLLISVVAGILLPALGIAGSPDIAEEGLEILHREKIGVYDTVTLSATNATTLLSWLSMNGFVIPTNSLPVIQDYAREGWIFVASKLRLASNPGEPVAAHPLSFTFKTSRPVYPLRLTGIDNNPCKIDLYVFGSNQVTVANFKVQQSEQPEYPTSGEYASYRYWEFPIRHPALVEWLHQSPVATKLSGTLTSEDMRKDAYLSWVPYQHDRLVRYSAAGAISTATNFVCVPLVVLLLVFYWMGSSETGLSHAGQRNSAIAAGILVVGWLAMFLMLPKVPVRVTRFSPFHLQSTFKNVRLVLLLAFEDQTPSSPNKNPPSLESQTSWLREKLKVGSDARKELDSKLNVNRFTGMPWHEEDSPGNYTIHQESNDVVAVWYDSHGHENEFFRMSEALAR